MNLESQCCSLELSKRLKELGVKSESFFHWYVSHRSGYSFILESKEVNYCVDSKDNYDVYSAHTAAELGEMLKPVKSFITEFLDDQVVLYENQDDDSKCNEEFGCGSNEANARAMMLIFLIENGHVDTNKGL